jgi:Nickel responsive protein SCO4226-like
MLFTAKCFWPGVTEGDLRVAAAQAERGTEDPRTTFRGALYLPGDELVLCLFDASSRAEVKQASERAGMPCERVIETVWVAPHDEGGDEARA